MKQSYMSCIRWPLNSNQEERKWKMTIWASNKQTTTALSWLLQKLFKNQQQHLEEIMLVFMVNHSVGGVSWPNSAMWGSYEMCVRRRFVIVIAYYHTCLVGFRLLVQVMWWVSAWECLTTWLVSGVVNYWLFKCVIAFNIWRPPHLCFSTELPYFGI